MDKTAVTKNTQDSKRYDFGTNRNRSDMINHPFPFAWTEQNYYFTQNSVHYYETFQF